MHVICLLQRRKGMRDTHQHVQWWMLLLEGLCELPDFACLGQIHNMDVNLLEWQIWVSFTGIRYFSVHFFWMYCKARPNGSHSLYSQTQKRCLTWPPLLCHYSCTPCGPSHLCTKHQSWFCIGTGDVAKNTSLQSVPFLAIAIAVAFPIPLLAPVIIKDRPTTDTSRSLGSNSLDAASYPFLLGQRKYAN